MCDQINQCFMSVHFRVILDTHIHTHTQLKKLNVCILDTC